MATTIKTPVKGAAKKGSAKVVSKGTAKKMAPKAACCKAGTSKLIR